MFRDAQITATAAERFANPLLNTAESPEMVRDEQYPVQNKLSLICYQNGWLGPNCRIDGDRVDS